MADWIVTLAILGLVIHKLGSRTELDVGRVGCDSSLQHPKLGLHYEESLPNIKCHH